MFDRTTEAARRVMAYAREEALHFNHNYVGTEHLLLGLRREDESVAAQVLRELGIELDAVREQLENIVGYSEEDTGGQAPLTPRSKNVLELALEETLQIRDEYIGPEHILLGLTDEPDGIAARILVNLDADLEAVRYEVFGKLGVQPEPPPDLGAEPRSWSPRLTSEQPGGHPRPFYRSRYDRAIAGVCGGIAQYFGWDPRLVRVAVAGLVIATGGAGLAAYLLFWIFLPMEPYESLY